MDAYELSLSINLLRSFPYLEHLEIDVSSADSSLLSYLVVFFRTCKILNNLRNVIFVIFPRFSMKMKIVVLKNPMNLKVCQT